MKAELAQSWAGFWDQRTEREKTLLAVGRRGAGRGDCVVGAVGAGAGRPRASA